MSAKRERRKVSSENGRKPGSCCCARSYIIIYGAGRKDRIYTAKWKRKSVRMWGKWVKEKRQAGEIERGKSLSFDTAYKILDKLSTLWWSGLGGKRSLDDNQGALRVSRQKSRQQAAKGEDTVETMGQATIVGGRTMETCESGRVQGGDCEGG